MICPRHHCDSCDRWWSWVDHITSPHYVPWLTLVLLLLTALGAVLSLR